MKQKNKLNLGCGRTKLKGWFNVDISPEVNPDKVVDANKKLPFKDNFFKEIKMIQVLEHLDNPVNVINELWRVGKNNCKIHLEVPHFTSPSAWGDLTHKRPFAWGSFDYVAINEIYKDSVEKLHTHEYGKARFNVTQKLIFGKLHRFIGISFLANKKPYLYEMMLAYIFPAREIHFDLIVVK